MAFEVESTGALARRVSLHKEAPSGVTLREVPELSGKSSTTCSASELLCWMGWLTAGPPSLTAEALRTAGAWALLRYFWALGYNPRGAVVPTEEATAIRNHNRVSFSEAVGVGVGGQLAVSAIAPGGPVLVANLDDAIHLLRSTGLVSTASSASKLPDYLLASLGPAGWRLMAVECKGTVGDLSTSVEQMARGVKQVQALSSRLPLRRLVFGAALHLDGGEKREVKAYAVEVGAARGAKEPMEELPSAVLDAALVRGLRCAGMHELADSVRAEGVPPGGLPLPQVEENLDPIARRQMMGASAVWRLADGDVRAELGIDLEMLRALAAEQGSREDRVREVLERSSQRGHRTRENSVEHLMPDGIGLRLAWSADIRPPSPASIERERRDSNPRPPA